MADRSASYPSAILVTGAGGAIGAALCDELVRCGVKVIATDRFPLQSDAHLDGDIVWVTADLEKAGDRQALVDTVQKVVSGSLGIIHNASFVGDSHLDGWVGPLEVQSTETWGRALEVGLTAAFSITRDLSPELQRNHGSAIVHVSSIYSSLGPDWALYGETGMGNPAAYGVAKAGLEQLTRWLATTLSPNVRVNAVAPGGLTRNQPQEFVENYLKKVPLARMGNELDVVDAVLFLLSSASAYITGHVLVVDGGYSVT